jgi:hypothetical protein
LATPSEVPVDPSAAEAQQWARDELARAIYNQEPSLWDRFWLWLLETLTDILTGMPAGGSPLVPLLVVLALAVVVALVFAWHGRLQRTRRAATASATVFDDARSAATLRADSEAAARRGDLDAAVLDRFRAVVRSLDERVLLDDRPGLTAHEASLAGASLMPGLEQPWAAAAGVFDAVRYGHITATPANLETMRRLDDAVAGQVVT